MRSHSGGGEQVGHRPESNAPGVAEGSLDGAGRMARERLQPTGFAHHLGYQGASGPLAMHCHGLDY